MKLTKLMKPIEPTKLMKQKSLRIALLLLVIVLACVAALALGACSGTADGTKDSSGQPTGEEIAGSASIEEEPATGAPQTSGEAASSLGSPSEDAADKPVTGQEAKPKSGLKDPAKAKLKTPKSVAQQAEKNSEGEKAATAPSTAPSSMSGQPKTITVTIAIDCKTAYAKDPDAVSGLSDAGIILAAKQLSLSEGANVRQALEACGVRFTARGAYISGIGGLSEGDLGPQSGWVYSVNGVFPSVSCTAYRLNANDSIAWRYTCNQGVDVGSRR